MNLKLPKESWWWLEKIGIGLLIITAIWLWLG